MRDLQRRPQELAFLKPERAKGPLHIWMEKLNLIVNKMVTPQEIL